MDYFFKVGDRHAIIGKLKEFFNSRPYIKTKTDKTLVFTEQFHATIAEYQKYHNLKLQGGVLNEEVYAQIGKEMMDYQIDLISVNAPELRKLLYGVGLESPCANWEAVGAVIPKDKFIGWGYAGVTKNCYSYCVKQLSEVGHSLKSPGWGTKTKMNPHIYQLYLTEDIAGMKKGYQAQQFTEGVLYLKKALRSKTPVMVGVEDGEGSPNADKVTDHYVVIVGMGTDSVGNYFLFYDNATGDNAMGTSDQNRIYANCETYELKGSGPNNYIQNSQYKSYIVTQIRETK